MTYFYVILKMNENKSIETIDKTKFWLSEKIGIENYLYREINQRKPCSKKLNKYVTVFDYIDKILIVLSATTSGVSVISFTSIVGAPVGIASASFTLIFSLTTGIVEITEYSKKKKEKHDKILMLAKSKLNSVEKLISQALNDMEIIHEEFITIFEEKDKCERIKDNLRSESKKYMSNNNSCKATYKIKDLKSLNTFFKK